MQIKTMVRYHLTPVRMAIIKKTQITKVFKEREPLYTVGGNGSWYSHCGTQYEGFSKNSKYNYHMTQQFHP